ncbi:MAG TPA: efflux RND transporter periplasmic adaptor subunit [Chthonomonadaceae bacterium]|nr:efflux RND transporter periplasmic adaptor subunit [Chthonomonadaceae bacterium]
MVSEQAAAPPTVRRKAKRNMRPLIGFTVLAVLAGGGWFGWVKTHPPEDPNAKLLTDTVKKGDLIESVSASGSVTAQTGAQVKIGSQITGVIRRLYADVGSKVKAGETIAELDLPDIRAQLVQAQANLDAAQTKLQQQQSGVAMEHTQTSSAVAQAQADLNSANAALRSAQAVASQQTAETPNDIKRAESAVGTAQAALSTANSTLKQVQASANLQISNAQEQVNQAQATAKNTAITLKRNQDLLKQGFVAASVVDAAQAADSVAQSQIAAAQQNVSLVKEKVAADVQSAKDQVSQAQQNLASAQAALTSAQAGTFTVAARNADVVNARAKVRQMEAALRTARGNVSQDVLKGQDVEQAREAVREAQAQVAYNQAQLNKTIIKSPISGTVLQLASQQGETLAAGLSAPTLIIVADLNRLQVDAFVDETDIGKIHLGQEADITVDAFPKRVFKGHVTKVASGSTIQQGVITYDVTIALDGIRKQAPATAAAGRGAAGARRGAGGRPAAGGPATGGPGRAGGADTGAGQGGGAGDSAGQDATGGRQVNPMKLLKPDMTASVTIQTGVRKDVLLVPSEAVKVGKRGTTVTLLVKGPDGKDIPTPTKVRTGGTDGTFTEIRDGVKEGDKIVLAGLDQGGPRFGPQSPFGPSGGNRAGGSSGAGGGGARRGG